MVEWNVFQPQNWKLHWWQNIRIHCIALHCVACILCHISEFPTEEIFQRNDIVMLGIGVKWQTLSEVLHNFWPKYESRWHIPIPFSRIWLSSTSHRDWQLTFYTEIVSLSAFFGQTLKIPNISSVLTLANILKWDWNPWMIFTWSNENCLSKCLHQIQWTILLYCHFHIDILTYPDSMCFDSLCELLLNAEHLLSII